MRCKKQEARRKQQEKEARRSSKKEEEEVKEEDDFRLPNKESGRVVAPLFVLAKLLHQPPHMVSATCNARRHHACKQKTTPAKCTPTYSHGACLSGCDFTSPNKASGIIAAFQHPKDEQQFDPFPRRTRGSWTNINLTSVVRDVAFLA